MLIHVTCDQDQVEVHIHRSIEDQMHIHILLEYRGFNVGIGYPV